MSQSAHTTTPQLQRMTESSGVLPIPSAARTHTQVRDTLWLWFSANLSLPSLTVGMLSHLVGVRLPVALALCWGMTVVGALPVAFLCTLGPQTGLTQMGLARFAFGARGAQVTALCNALTCIGWNAISAAAGALILFTWSAERVPASLWIVLLTLATTLIACYGYTVVHRSLRLLWIPLALLFGYIAWKALIFRMPLPTPTASTTETTSAALVTFGGAVFARVIGWAPYAADFTRKHPASTPAARVFWYAFFGLLLPCGLLETLGVFLTRGTPLGQNPGVLLTSLLRDDPLMGLVLVLVGLTTIPNNLPGSYSLWLCLRLVGVRIQRSAVVICGALAYGGLALLVVAHFAVGLEHGLLLTGDWVAAWCAVVLVEHLRCHGRYALRPAWQPLRFPPSTPALLACVLGIGCATLGLHQFGQEGPLSALAGGADLGNPLSLLGAGGSYWLLRAHEMSRQRTRQVRVRQGGMVRTQHHAVAAGKDWASASKVRFAPAWGPSEILPAAPPPIKLAVHLPVPAPSLQPGVPRPIRLQRLDHGHLSQSPLPESMAQSSTQKQERYALQAVFPLLAFHQDALATSWESLGKDAQVLETQRFQV